MNGHITCLILINAYFSLAISDEKLGHYLKSLTQHVPGYTVHTVFNIFICIYLYIFYEFWNYFDKDWYNFIGL